MIADQAKNQAINIFQIIDEESDNIIKKE